MTWRGRRDEEASVLKAIPTCRTCGWWMGIDGELGCLCPHEYPTYRACQRSAKRRFWRPVSPTVPRAKRAGEMTERLQEGQKWVKDVRTRLGLTQEQLSRLLGVCVMTISKWERGILKPSGYQLALLASFGKAQQHLPESGTLAVAALNEDGVAAALYVLLRGAYSALECQKD